MFDLHDKLQQPDHSNLKPIKASFLKPRTLEDIKMPSKVDFIFQKYEILSVSYLLIFYTYNLKVGLMLQEVVQLVSTVVILAATLSSTMD